MINFSTAKQTLSSINFVFLIFLIVLLSIFAGSATAIFYNNIYAQSSTGINTTKVTSKTNSSIKITQSSQSQNIVNSNSSSSNNTSSTTISTTSSIGVNNDIVKIYTLDEINSIGTDKIIVNKFNGLPEGFVPEELVNTELAGNGIVTKKTQQALILLFEDAKSQGFDLMLTSSYRSYEEQKEQLSVRVQYELSIGATTEQEAEYKALQYVSKPGFSEHQLGTAVDMACTTCAGPEAEINKRVYEYLEKNAPKFGFKQSYPENNIKGFGYEPWHWRYVGN